MLQRSIKRWGNSPRRSPLDDGLGFTIRFASPEDDAALRRLAALDSQPLPPGPLLVAEVAGELWAGISLTDEPRAIADPFRHTAELVVLLRERADRLVGRGRTAPSRAQPAPRLAWP
ncbi:MAG TPA: hypothetical protein VGH45_12840 [Solirubrobacteraceae bacterium]|jgi:hypothetical protein